MNKTITLDKNQLADIMLGSVITTMKDTSELMKHAMYDEHIKDYRKMAQHLINKHGEAENVIVGTDGAVAKKPDFVMPMVSTNKKEADAISTPEE